MDKGLAKIDFDTYLNTDVEQIVGKALVPTNKKRTPIDHKLGNDYSKCRLVFGRATKKNGIIAK